MASFNSYISREVIGRAWGQIQESMVSDDNRLRQLLSFKPIDLYDTNTSLQVNGAKIDMEIKSYLENVLKKRASKGIRFWPFDRLSSQEPMKYQFNVVVNGKMDYKNIEIWVRNSFKDQLFSFRNGRYHLKLQDVKQIGQRDGKLFFELALQGSIKFLWFRFRLRSTLNFELVPVYDNKQYMVRVKNLDYEFTTSNILLNIFDKYYHAEFKRFLEEHVEISIREDLFTARIMAQEEMNKYQRKEKLIFNGYLNDLELERLSVEKKGIEAVFHAGGAVEFVR